MVKETLDENNKELSDNKDKDLNDVLQKNSLFKKTVISNFSVRNLNK